MFEIEKNVPFPVGTSGDRRGRPQVYPFPSMAVGDSFFIESQGEDKAIRGRVASAASNWSNRYPAYAFCLRRVDGGYRVWRIATAPKLVAAE